MEAISLDLLPQQTIPLIFTGCCWGALTVRLPAAFALPGREIGPRTPDRSIALRFLLQGATAFIGCTGTHYSPPIAPYQYFGGPMHTAFWNALQTAGQAAASNAVTNGYGDISPAEALLHAKFEYVRGYPHADGGVAQAIESKLIREYTCLGLGW